MSLENKVKTLIIHLSRDYVSIKGFCVSVIHLAREESINRHLTPAHEVSESHRPRT